MRGDPRQARGRRSGGGRPGFGSHAAGYDRPVPAAEKLLAVAACAVAVAGCSGDDERLPAACRTDSASVIRALDRAPRPVRIRGVPISHCLTHGSSAEDVELVGSILVGAASELGDAARRRPGGRAAVSLGYLIGAAHRGGARTQGLHAELVRRLDQEAYGVDSRALRRGERAGRRQG
jgi:hypothetical protein